MYGLIEDFVDDASRGKASMHLGYQLDGYGPAMDKITTVSFDASELFIKDALRVIQDYLSDVVTYSFDETDRLCVVDKEGNIKWAASDRAF